MIITSASLQALQTGFNTSYRQGFGRTPNFSDRLLTRINSNAAIETYGWMLSLGRMREWVGPRVVNNLASTAYQLANKKFEYTLGVARDEIEDDRLGLYAARFELMGFQVKKWPDQLAKEALQAGATATTFDGSPFFSASHNLNAAGNQSNNFTATPLNAANYDTVRTAMMSYTDSSGEMLGVNPRLLVVPPQLAKTAMDIVSAQFLAGGATNVLAGSAEVLVIPELGNQPTTWYLMDDSMPIKPLVFQQRQAPEFAQQTDPNSDAVFHQDMYYFGVRARGAVGYGLWFLAARAIA
jgi:phage major head subunit gpT-like protein